MELDVGANNGTKVIALIMARRRSVLARAAGDGNGNTEPTQKDEKTEDEADKVCLVNHTTSRSERERTGQRVMASA